MNALALFLSYLAFAVGIYWICKIEIPAPNSTPFVFYYAVTAAILLPLIGIISIKFGDLLIFRILGWMYLVLWAIAVLRFLDLMLSE
jgi:hypothetical protein